MTVSTSQGYRGVGRGPKSRDGCSVDLYLKLPYGGEVELFRSCIPGESSVIELGCGVGRITRELLARGYRVTAVDNSPEMLAHVPSQACKICSDIETLALKPGGRLILERYDPTWLANVQIGPLGNFGDVEMQLDHIHRDGAKVEICLRYRCRGEEWLHHFSAAVLDDDEIYSCLVSAGFEPPSWIDRRWASVAVMKNAA
jgi:SAM-dependent methyltransferase